MPDAICQSCRLGTKRKVVVGVWGETDSKIKTSERTRISVGFDIYMGKECLVRGKDSKGVARNSRSRILVTVVSLLCALVGNKTGKNVDDVPREPPLPPLQAVHAHDGAGSEMN